MQRAPLRFVRKNLGKKQFSPLAPNRKSAIATLRAEGFEEFGQFAGRGVIAGGSNNVVPVEATEKLSEYVYGEPSTEDEEE